MSAWDAIQGMLLVALVYGFCPGFVLRLVLLLYPKDDPRRAELLGEHYALPRWKRPVWVAEQLETAVFEGPSQRRANRHKRQVDQERQDIEQAEVAKTDPATFEEAEKKTRDAIEGRTRRKAGRTGPEMSSYDYSGLLTHEEQFEEGNVVAGGGTVSAELRGRAHPTVGDGAASSYPRTYPRHYRAGENGPTSES